MGHRVKHLRAWPLPAATAPFSSSNCIAARRHAARKIARASTRQARAGDPSPARAARLSSHGAGSNGISPQNADLFTGGDFGVLPVMMSMVAADIPLIPLQLLPDHRGVLRAVGPV